MNSNKIDTNARTIVLDALIKELASASKNIRTEEDAVKLTGDVKYAYDKAVRRIKADGFSDSCISDFIKSVPGYETNPSSLHPAPQYIVDCHRRIHEHLMVSFGDRWLSWYLSEHEAFITGRSAFQEITLIALANGYKPKEFNGNMMVCRKYVYLIALLFFFAHHEALDQLTAEAKAATGESK